MYIKKNMALLFGLLLSCFPFNDIPNQSIDKLDISNKDLIFLETVYSSKVSKNTTRMKKKGEEWIAYKKILSGDFSLIEDESDRNHLQTNYEWSIEEGGGKCIWRYILMDFNNNGTQELFVQYNPDPYNDNNEDFDSASDFYRSGYEGGIFYYKDGKVICLWSDTLDANFYSLPLKGGKLLDVSAGPPVPMQFIGHLDSEYNRITEKEYFSVIIDYEYQDKEFYNWLFEEYNISQEGIYYFFQEYKNGQENGKRIRLSKAQWLQIEKRIDKLLIPDSEWNYCSDLNVVR